MGSFKKDYPSIVLRNRKLTDTLWLMTLKAAELAKEVAPGQFVHMEMPTLQANILRRPFSIYDTSADEGTVDILYQVVGTGTADMTKWQPGYLTNMIGPIGREWEAPEDASSILLVGGGVGAAPLFMLCKQLIEDGLDVDVILGAASQESLVCLERYQNVCGSSLSCSTDDGSFGRKGFATVLAEEAISQKKYDFVAACGPEPLMRAVSQISLSQGIPTQISMERRMACGIGACLSCVVDTKQGKKRACVDGPIFDAEVIEW